MYAMVSADGIFVRWLDHEDGALTNEISAFTKESPSVVKFDCDDGCAMINTIKFIEFF